MASFNQVTLVGNLTRDVELRTIASGTAVAEVSLAVNERIKRGDKWEDKVHFIDCVLWGRTAEIAAEYLAKGRPVLFSGSLQQDQWEQDGQKRSKIKVKVSEMTMLGSPSGGQQAPAAERPARTRPEPAKQASISYDEVTGAPGEDVPF